MDDRPQDYQAPSAFADRVFGGNPFPKDDTRHELWETNARYAAEEYARLDAKWLKRLPPERAKPEEFMIWILDVAVGRYDVLFKRVLIFTVKSVSSAVLYEQFLADAVKFMITNARENCPKSIPKELFLSELRIRFKQRTAHWKSEALRLARDSEEPREKTLSAAERVQAENTVRVSSAAGNDSSQIIGEPRGQSAAQPANKAGMQSEEAIWGEIDHELVARMVEQIEGEMDQKYGSRRDQIFPNVNRPEPAYVFPLKVARLCVERTKESLSALFQIYCDVWEQQGQKQTPAFVRVVLTRSLLPTIENGMAKVKQILRDATSRLTALRDHAGEDEIAIRSDDIIQDLSRLAERCQNEMEIEARKLEWKQAKQPMQPPAPQSEKRPTIGEKLADPSTYPTMTVEKSGRRSTCLDLPSIAGLRTGS